MFKPHPLEQRLLILFKILTSAEPPVINYLQSATCKLKNRGNILQTTNRKYITQKISYQRHPTARIRNSKLKKAKEKRTTPPNESYRTVPATAKPKKKKNPYSPAAHTTKSAQLKSYRHGTPHSGDTHTKYT
jgi:hypothetical protein